MNIMNYHLYTNSATMMQIMAEDTGVAELGDSVFYMNTDKKGRLSRIMERAREKRNSFRSAQRQCRCIGMLDQKPRMQY